MKKLMITGVQCFLFALAAVAQKPVLDTGVIYHWPSLVWDKAILTADGNYVGYEISNYQHRDPVYFMKSSYSAWEKQIPGVTEAVFTADSREMICLQGATLHIVRLGSDEDETIAGVSAYQLFKRGKEEYLLCYSKSEKKVIIRGSDKQERTYGDADGWLLSGDGTTLLIRSDRDKNNQSVRRTNLQTGMEQVIWDGPPVVDWVMGNGSQVALHVKDQDGQNQLLYCAQGQDKATPVANDHSAGIDKGLTIGKLLNFSKDGSRLVFKLWEGLPKPDPNKVSVDVWSYFDPQLQSQQLSERPTDMDYLATVALDNGNSITRLQRAGEKVSGKTEGPYVLFVREQGAIGEYYWSAAAQRKFDFVDIRTGKRTVIDYPVYDPSPGMKYFLLYNKGDLFAYDLSGGGLVSLTSRLPIPHKKNNDEPSSKDQRGLLSVIGWLPEDKGIIICDYYDVWELDPKGIQAPINLTHFEGVKSKISFASAKGYGRGLIKDDSLILTAIDRNNMNNGFYRIALHKEQMPEKLSMGPYAYYIPYDEVFLNNGVPVVKAENANVYLVRRESASESANFYVTKDFKDFRQVSDVHPERAYNWLRTKLISFKTTDGRDEQGILYTPENFDNSRKYPLIFTYYQRRTAELNLYPPAEGHNGDLNVPWFVSHGYLVFIPDIHFAIGKSGESVVQTILGAAKLLKTFPYVDGNHMGLQGHSYGGWETDFLVTRTNEFAAALASCGPSDWVSDYGGLWAGGDSHSEHAENRQGRMGASIWERPDYYIENSPVYYADKVNTPLMMIANKFDHNVDFTQDLEFFTALRRLGKRVWMLQYDKGGHGVDGDVRMDYLIRSQQFFDHYLKGAPAPKWMVEGVPAAMKQVDNGLELEPPGVKPGPGLLTPEARRAVDALEKRKPITVTFN
ncbi:MAG: prolyl oligopeptidase family serine peptidase [Bacteroidota bacterium]|nr:prolyl oligopeptidase family serine peptidase [Bacteroidota bacterium]MDP4253386.1 prolyl oligopeptidase family serine peptidase [Bacteroidota bacterium]MDP4258048.1 prolyl oligopeptidase family serine peptidase [Bacteroidota bacterium]